ncbi:MAG: hypothetical protein IJZ25_02155 [Lachnospiraceae bacterium]|nr:hypothetical protein [Lachnospiraceae bacterium]
MDYQTTKTGTVKLTVNPKDPGVSVSMSETVSSSDLKTGEIKIKAATSGVFKITTQGITKDYTYSVENVGTEIKIPATDFFSNAVIGNSTLEYKFTPDEAPYYKEATGTIDYMYTSDGVVYIEQADSGTVSVEGKTDSMLVFPTGEYTVNVTPVAGTSTIYSSVKNILVDGTAVSEELLTRNSDGSVTTKINVMAGKAVTVSAEYNYKKLAVNNNATVYINAGDSLAKMNEAVFNAVVNQSKSVGISSSDIYTTYYQGIRVGLFDGSRTEVWSNLNSIAIGLFMEDSHNFGMNSEKSYKESIRITVPGTTINVTVTVTAYRRSVSFITVDSEKIVLSQSDYNYSNVINAIGAKLNGSANDSLQYVLADGTSFTDNWNSKSGGDEFTVTVKYAGTTNGASSTGSAEKTVNVYIRPEMAVTPASVKKVYTGEAVDIKVSDFSLTIAGGNSLPVTVNSITYFDASKNTLESVPEKVGNYYIKLNLSDKYGNFESDYIPLEITFATNSWVTEPSVNSWVYGDDVNIPSFVSKFGTVTVKYTGTANDNTSWDSENVPVKAGNYTATFKVEATADYGSLEKKIDFTINRATYDMTDAKWDYTDAFIYDGLMKTVAVTGLPEGVKVESYSNNTFYVVGDYTANVILDYDKCNYNEPVVSELEWKIENNWTPNEYITSAPNSNGWLKEDFVITAADGYELSLTNTADGVWSETLVGSVEGTDSSVTFYMRNKETGAISLQGTESYKLDKNTETTGTTGTVYFDERNGWEEFLNSITFDLFYNAEVTVKVDAEDALSDVEVVEYAESAIELTLDDVKAITDWTVMPESGVPVTLEDTKQFIYYVRITDKAGNITYLSTDGTEYDTTAPAINGIENEGTYYTTQDVTVFDKNLDTVTLNGELVTGVETMDVDSGELLMFLEGNKEATYTIVATDKAGNSTTFTVTMKPVADISTPIDSVTEEEVKSTDKDTVQEIIDQVDELLADDSLTEEEKTALEEIRDVAESLVNKVEEAAAATNTENTEKVEDVTAENVTPDNKIDLENAKADLESALENNSGNYTDDEKKAIEDEIERIDNALEIIEKVETVENQINQLPETITKSDEESVKAAEEAYNALTEYEKSIVSEDVKKTLETAVAALSELNKPADPSSPATGDNANIPALLILMLGSLAVMSVSFYGAKKKRIAEGK